MSGSISGVSVQAADSHKSLITDVQFYEMYTSTALNRKFKNIIKPGVYSGFNVVPGVGLKVVVTSGDGVGAASIDFENIQLSVQQHADIEVEVPAGTTTIIALQGFYKFGVKTSQVSQESTVNAAEIVTITDQQLRDGQIELCRVVVPAGATQISPDMIDTSSREYRSLGLQLSAELDSEEEGVAANSLAIKRAISFLLGDGVPEALATLSQLAAAINNDDNFAQTVNKALDLKAPLASPALTGTPTAPTAVQTANNTQVANTAFVKAAIAALVDSSPAALDTLNELAEALGNDPHFSTTVTNALAGKQPLNTTLTDLSGKTVAGLLEYLGLGAGAPPIGIPFFWPSAAMPNTVMPEWSEMVFLKPNGATFSADIYPRLAKVWTGLVIPDMRGEFLRVWDDGRGVDAGRALLSSQGETKITNFHGNGNATDELGGGVPGAPPKNLVYNADSKSNAGAGFSAYGSQQMVASGVTSLFGVRPRNVAFNFLVRAK